MALIGHDCAVQAICLILVLLGIVIGLPLGESSGSVSLPGLLRASGSSLANHPGTSPAILHSSVPLYCARLQALSTCP